MRKKLSIICTICIIVYVAFCNIPQKPKLISCITTFDTAYLTILVDRKSIKNVENLEEEILQMCRADSFDNIKLQTEDKPMAQRLHISVYFSEQDLEKGTPYLTIKNDAGE